MKRIRLSWQSELSVGEKTLFRREWEAENLRRIGYAVPALLALEIALFVFRDQFPGAGPATLAFIAGNLLWLPLFLITFFRREKAGILLLRIVNLSYAALGLLFAVALALFVGQNIDMIHVYIMGVIAVTAFLNLNMTEAAVLHGGSALLLIFLLPFFHGNEDFVRIASVNVLSFLFLTLVLNRIHLALRTKAFLLRRNLEAANETLAEHVRLDAMTGLLNHSTFFTLLDSYCKGRREDQGFALIILDIDNFKRVNDEHGHLAGDDVIRKVALTLQESARKGDQIGRYGGEEFILLLPGADEMGALGVMERIRQGLSRGAFPEGIAVTVSAGISIWGGEDIDTLIAVTDKKMYKAKEAGKNAVFLD